MFCSAFVLLSRLRLNFLCFICPIVTGGGIQTHELGFKSQLLLCICFDANMNENGQEVEVLKREIQKYRPKERERQ